MLIFDMHLDLAMNATLWNRDLTRPIDEIRERERDLTDYPDRGNGVVCLPEMRRGGVGMCVSTLIARYVKPGNPLPGSNSPEQAWAMTHWQLAWYRAMEEAGEMTAIVDVAGLEHHAALWKCEPPPDAPIGYVLSMECADPIITPAHLEGFYEQGVRAVGPAHYGPGTYAQGTEASGGLGPRGRELLNEMERLNVILDATHLCDESFWEAMDHFHGPVWASHSNCRAVVPGERQFSDEQIRLLIEHGAIIGAVLDAWMVIPGWIKHKTLPEEAGLKMEHVVDHIDRICQLAGNAHHVCIGSDLDGGFGREQCPADLNTIADLARYEETLAARGYAPSDVEAILHGNVVRYLKKVWS